MPLNDYILSIILQAAFTISMLISAPLMKIMNRRTQYLMSMGLISFSMLMLSYCMFSIDLTTGALHEIMKVGQPLFVIMVGFAYGIGIGPITFALTNEVFPARAKGICGTLAMASK